MQAGAGDADATARSRLVAIVIEHGDLFADATAGEAFCAVETDGGAVRTYKVASAAFTDWLLGEYGERYAETIDGRRGARHRQRLDQGRRGAGDRGARPPRRARAKCSCGSARAVDRIFIDMATPEPRAIEVGPNGWSIVVDPPVHRVHSATAKPLPEPAPAVSRRRVIRRLARFFGFRPTDDVRAHARLLDGAADAARPLSDADPHRRAGQRQDTPRADPQALDRPDQGADPGPAEVRRGSGDHRVAHADRRCSTI